MQTISQWETALTNHFEKVGRSLNLDSKKDSQKVFCIEEGKNGVLKTVFLSSKMQEMRQGCKTDEEYDKQMNKLIKNGSIRFYEEGSVEGKSLSVDTSKNNEITLVSKGMGLAQERGGVFYNLWKTIKGLFSPAARIEQAAEQFFDKYQSEREQEIVPENVEKNKRHQEKAATIQTEKVFTDLENRFNTEKTFDKSVKEIFGKNTSLDFIKQNGYSFSNEPIEDIKLDDLANTYSFCKEESLPYLSLCVGLGCDENLSELPLNLMQTAIIEKCLLGEYNGKADTYIETFIKNAKENTNKYIDDLNNGNFSRLGTGLLNGIKTMNRMLSTSQPSEFVDPNSKCMLTAKCIKETMDIINSNPKLKSAVNLSGPDEVIAKGACEIWDIAKKSIDAQKELCNNTSCDIEKQAAFIEKDIKMRAELFNSGYSSGWHKGYREAKSRMEPSNDRPMLRDAYLTQTMCKENERYPNLAVVEIAEKPKLLTDSKIKLSLKDNLLGAKPTDIKLNLTSLIKNETQSYSQNRINEVKQRAGEAQKQKVQKTVSVQKQAESTMEM